MDKEAVIQKLKDFRVEIEDCQSMKELEKIEERLKRKLKEIYLDNDPFITRCYLKRGGMSPSKLREISNFLM